MKELAELKCWDCRLRIDPEDIVVMDIISTLTHDFCEPTGLEVWDTGSFEELAKKYKFFYKK